MSLSDEQQAIITETIRSQMSEGLIVDEYALLKSLRIAATSEICEWIDALVFREQNIAKNGLEAVERYEAATSHRAVGYHEAPALVRRPIMRRPRGRAAARGRRTTSRVAVASHGPPGRPGDDEPPPRRRLASRVLARLVALVRRGRTAA